LFEDKFQKLKNKVQNLEVEVLSDKRQKEKLAENIKNTQNEIGDLENETITYEKASLFLQGFSKQRREQGQAIFSEMGTMALQNIYGEGYRLEIQYDVKRSKPVAEVYIVSPYSDLDENEIQYSSEYAAGGENDVISFAMKLPFYTHISPNKKGLFY